MTDDASASEPISQDERKFIRSPSGRLTRKLVGGPERLNTRMLRMIELMVYGHEDDPERTPYDVADAAQSVGYRTRAGRMLLATPIFSAALAKEIDAFRKGERARCLHTAVKIRDEEGAGKAADRKVRLDASKMIFGEEGGGGRGGGNVNVNVGLNVTPGLVIRVRDPDQGNKLVESSASASGRID
jgi:hypothetical protein